MQSLYGEEAQDRLVQHGSRKTLYHVPVACNTNSLRVTERLTIDGLWPIDEWLQLYRILAIVDKNILWGEAESV
jgi:hypothetical protein